MYRKKKNLKEGETDAIPVFVEEDHHHVVHHILRCVGAGRIPLEGKVTMIHLDSHPDMLLPTNVTEEQISDVPVLMEKLSIESWILPLVYMGILDTVVWVRPWWSTQIPDGTYQFLVGKKTTSDVINVTCAESYFVSEGIACSQQDIEVSSSKKLNLIVQRINQVEPMLKECKDWILDIDLDYFSTKNPFKEMFVNAGFYTKLKDIYVFDYKTSPKSSPASAIEASSKRKQLIEQLHDLTGFLHQGGEIDKYCGPGTAHVPQMKALKDSIVESYGADAPIDWEIVHNAGCTCDDTELPHHVSTLEEVCKMMSELGDNLKEWTSRHERPLAVTVARSSLDDFCPADQVELIQEKTLGVLASGLGEVNTYLLYESE